MNAVTIIMLIFSVLGGIDRFFGNKLKLGEEFEKGFMLLGNLVLSMMGMIVISPLIAHLMSPLFEIFYGTFHIDPSILPAMFFASDMGAASLAKSVAHNPDIAMFNGLIVSSMIGCTVSFTLPYVITSVDKKHHDNIFLGFLCGIATIPVGCFIAGLFCSIKITVLIITLLPLIIFSILITLSLIFFKSICIKVFKGIAVAIKCIITLGLVFGIINFLIGKPVIPYLDTLENGAIICLNAAVIMTGAFPLLKIISIILAKPLKLLSQKQGINESSITGFISSLATSITTFEIIDKMDTKGIVLNSAFIVSASFLLADHLAFTIAFDSTYILPLIIGKLISGFVSIIVANLIYNKSKKSEEV